MLYSFEDFVLDTEQRELRQGPRLIGLQPQVFDLLAYLVANRHRVVSKDDIIAAVWDGRIVSESTLTTRINAARTAIADSGKEQRLLRTLSRKGIRFVGAVQEAQPSIPAVAGPARTALALPDRPSIAVLPFTNMSSEAEQEYFADGITEDIITALSKWRWFFVIARNSSFAYKGRAVDLKQVGRELGVRYVLEGSIRKSGNRIRLTTQLIDAVSGVHIWAERFDRNLGDVFALQDELTQHVASAIEPALSKVETEQAKRKTPDQMAAWDHYLRGMWHFHQFTADSAAQALASFRRAIELDDSLADAHAGVARTSLSRIMYHALATRDAHIADILQTARTALSLDNENLSALYALSIASSHNNDVEAGFEFAERATRLNENFALGHFAQAVASLYLGRPDDGLLAIDRAMRLSPSDPQTFAWRATRASALYLLQRYEEAVESARQSLRLSRYHTAFRVLAAGCAQLGSTIEAREAVRALAAIDSGDKTIAQVMRPFRRALDREHWRDGLGKAGMPEC